MMYTFLLEFAGGTYIAQHHGESVPAAIREYCATLKSQGIDGNVAAGRVLASEWQNTTPVEVQGCVNVWCLTTLVDEALVLCHVVKTERQDPLEEAPAQRGHDDT